MNSRTYVTLLLGTATSLLVLLAVGNALVDPYGIYGFMRVDGVNEVKPAAADVARTAKPFQVRQRQDWRTLIVGNSRPEMGIDPESECLPADRKPAYNMGLPGAGLAQQLDYARHAIAGAPIDTVLLFVDYVDALDPDDPDTRPWREDLDLPGHPRTGPRLTLHVQNLLSLDATIDSLLTLARQGDRYSSTRTAAGFNPAQDYLPIIRTEGVNVLFDQKLAQLSTRLERSRAYESGNGALDGLESFMTGAREQGIDVRVVINPYHVSYLEALRSYGHSEGLRRWKSDVERLAIAADVDLQDFAVRTSYTTEARPDDPNQALHWFWEPAHYTRRFGEEILSELFDAVCRPSLQIDTD